MGLFDDLVNDISKKTGLGNGRTGPKGLIDDINEASIDPLLNKLFDTLVDPFVDQNKNGPGWLTRWIDEPIGELTGRNIGRKQLQIQEKALKDEQKRVKDERAFAIQRQQAQEMQASQMAASRNRSLNLGSSGVRVGDASQIESQMATDFLGL